jgi:hypothetical protein
LIEGIDFNADTLLYGYQPITDLLVFSDHDLAMTDRAKGYGIATVANLWVGLFPLTIYIVYCFCTSDLESFVDLRKSSAASDDLDNAKEGGRVRNMEMKSLVENDSLVELQDEPREPIR